MTPKPATPQPVPQESVKISVIDAKSEDWAFYSETWELLEVLYEGGARLKSSVDRFIVRRPKEMYDVFYERARRLTYQDILQACISWHLSKMFQNETTVDIKSTDPRLTDFLQDCDRSGTTYDKFSRNLLEKMMLFRRAFVLVDKPKVDGSLVVVTKQHEQELGLDVPYLVLFDPRSVINWSTDSYGNLKWAVIKTINVSQESPFEPVQTVTTWLVYDKTTYRRYEYRAPKADPGNKDTDTRLTEGLGTDRVYATLVDYGEHALAQFNRVPIVVCELPTDLWHANRAFLHLLEHVDIMNAYSWKLFMANLPQLVVYSDEETSSRTLSEVGFLQFGQNDKVEWLEPKGSSFQETRMHLSSTRQEIYRAFHLQAQAKDSTATADGSSGYSKEVEMAPAVDILNALGDNLRGNMQNVLLAVKRAANVDVDKVPDVNGFQFEVHPTIQYIAKYDAALQAGVIQKSETLEKEVAKDIAMALTDGKNIDTKNKIKKEIMASAPTPVSVDPKQPGPVAMKAELQTKDTRAQAGNIIRGETGIQQ